MKQKQNKPQQIYGTSKAPMTGQTMVVGKKVKQLTPTLSSMTKGLKDIESKMKYNTLMALYEEKRKDYDEVCELYQNIIQTSVSQEIFDESVKKCEELIAANKTVAEQLSTERKNVELLQQQVHNKDVYISRLNSVIGQLNIQIFKA